MYSSHVLLVFMLCLAVLIDVSLSAKKEKQDKQSSKKVGGTNPPLNDCKVRTSYYHEFYEFYRCSTFVLIYLQKVTKFLSNFESMQLNTILIDVAKENTIKCIQNLKDQVKFNIHFVSKILAKFRRTAYIPSIEVARY